MAQFTDRIGPRDFEKMPPEYRDLLTRLLTIQADCEIGGPHIYVDHWTLRALALEPVVPGAGRLLAGRASPAGARPSR